MLFCHGMSLIFSFCVGTVTLLEGRKILMEITLQMGLAHNEDEGATMFIWLLRNVCYDWETEMTHCRPEISPSSENNRQGKFVKDSCILLCVQKQKVTKFMSKIWHFATAI